jgi:hypothetical protein
LLIKIVLLVIIFGVNDINWEERIYENCVIQFKPTYSIESLEHRGGWSSIIKYFIDNNFYNKKSSFYFFDTIENFFLWDNFDFLCSNNWFGIIHCTYKNPDYLDICNISNLFKNEKFIKSLTYCKGIIVLSNYLKTYLDAQFQELSINVKTYYFKHPCDVENIIYFNMNKYILNRDKKLIQIGQQLRKLSSIYLINDISHKKYGLQEQKILKNVKKC